MSDLVAPDKKTKDILSALRAKFSRVPQHVCLLLDVSYSMEGTRIRRLRELAARFRGVRRFIFSSDVVELMPNEDVPGEHGGTNMAGAFDHLRGEGITHTVIITDGEPDSEPEALKSSRGLRVDILYAGEPPAPPFLERLAKQSGGKYENVSLDDILAVEGKVQLLLPAPKKAIEL